MINALAFCFGKVTCNQEILGGLMTEIIVKPEPADQPDVEALMRLSDKVAAELYPYDARPSFDFIALASSGMVMFVARTTNGTAAGCCALILNAKNIGEIKRMIVHPSFRKLGVGKALVSSLFDVAHARGITLLLLEVGIRNVAAQYMYQNAGFRERGPFANHNASTSSRFMEVSALKCGFVKPA
ncbi:MAG: putative acetyltransferase [Candidatus Azotimanducaceae bacterium]